MLKSQSGFFMDDESKLLSRPVGAGRSQNLRLSLRGEASLKKEASPTFLFQQREARFLHLCFLMLIIDFCVMIGDNWSFTVTEK